MDELLNNPAVQGGVAPFLAGLLIAGLFVKVRTLAALGIVTGFLVAVMLTTGVQIDPMTSTRKIVVLILLVPFLGLILDMMKIEANEKVIGSLYAVAILSALWILWPVVSRDPVNELLPLLAYLVYTVWMIGIFVKFVEMPRVSAAVAATGTGFGIGIVSLIGASALLGQWGLAFGSAAAAYLLTQVLYRNDEPAGYTLSLSSAFISALMLPAAVVYAKVPMIALLLIAIVPLIAFYPFDEDRHIVKNLIGVVLVMAIPIGLAIYFTLEKAGAPMM